jgi:hypothetical protein
LLRHRTAAFILDLMHTELKGLKINENFFEYQRPACTKERKHF